MVPNFPLHVVIFTYTSVENFFRGWHSIGVPTPEEPCAGDANGVFWAPSSLDPKDQTRSYARSAHYDQEVQSRPNYHLLTGSAVRKVIFKEKTAVGVEYTNRETSEVRSVEAKQEVIIAAGTVHSPQILQLSGIGSETLLEGLGIETLVDLPGVGQNFQDHPTLYASYNCRFHTYLANPIKSAPGRQCPGISQMWRAAPPI